MHGDCTGVRVEHTNGAPPQEQLTHPAGGDAGEDRQTERVSQMATAGFPR